MAKRVNTTFLLGLSVAVVILGGVGLFMKWKSSHGDYRKHVNAALAFIKEGNYDAAFQEYTIATRLHPDTQLFVDRGDVAYHLVEDQGAPAVMQAIGSWENALEIDPRFKPALERLQDSYVEQIEYFPIGAPYGKFKDVAERLAKVDPSDQRAAANVYIADIAQWESGVGTFDKKLASSVQSLADIQKKDPTNADALFYLGRAKIHMARDLRQQGEAEKGDAQIAELRSILDATAAAQPKNAAINYRAYRLYAYLSRTHAKTEDGTAEKGLAEAALARARANVQPADRLYEDVVVETADRAIEGGKRDEGEQILHDYYQQHTNDRWARLRYVEALRRTRDVSKREEALRILRQPVIAQHEPGIRGVQVKQFEQQALEELLRLRLDQYAATTQPSERTVVMAQIDDNYKQISANVSGQSVGLMRLKAQIQEAKGARYDSLQTLKEAVDLMDHSSVKPPFQYDLIYDLAIAYRNLGQNKAAEERLQQVIQAYPAYTPARVNLAELYIGENNFTDAKTQIDLLAAQTPAAPEIVKLRLSLSLASRNGDASKEAYAQLPEDTAPAREYKAAQARRIGDYKEMLRLLDPNLKEKPGDPAASLMMTQAYFLLDQKDKAKEVLTEAISRNPGDENLKIAMQRVNGATPQQLQEFVKSELIAKGDQFSVNVREAQRADFEGRYDEALRQLKLADQLRPNQLSVWALYFDVYVRQRDYSAAEKAIGVLAPLDQDSNGNTYRWFLEMSQRHFDNAIKIAQELTKTRSAVSGSWTCLGKAYQANQQFNDAIAQYDAALQIQNKDGDAYLGRAQCYNALGQPDEAYRTLETALRFLPTNDTLREAYWTHAATHGNAVGVVPIREKLLADNPNNAANYYNLGYTAMAAADEVFARDLTAANKYTARAREVFSQGVEKFPDNVALSAKFAELLQKSGSFDDGLQVLAKLAARDAYKNNPEPLRLEADYFVTAGRMDEAEKYYRQALAQSNNSVVVELTLVRFLLGQGKFDAALDVLKLNSDDPRVNQTRLETLVNAKRLDEAKAGVDAALAKNPNDYFMLLLRLGIDVDQHRFDEARKVARQVLAIDPKSSMGQFFEALTEMRDPNGGDLELAVNDLNAVVTRVPSDLEARVQLAEVHRKRNEIEPAISQLEECLKLKGAAFEPKKREIRVMLLQILLDRANWPRFEQAVADAELNPALNSDPVWYYLHAEALAKQGDYPHAIEKIQQAQLLAKTDAAPYDREFLQILLQAPDKSRVLSETDKVIAGGNKTWWIYEARGRARAALDDKPHAIEELDQALALADAAKDVQGAMTVFRTIGQVIGYDQALQRLAGRIDSENYWRLLAVDLHVHAADWTGAIATVQPLLDKLQTMTPGDRLQAIQFAAESNQVLGENEAPNGPHQQAAKSLYIQWLGLEAMNRKALNNMAYLLAEAMKNPKEAKQYSQRAYDAERRNGNPDPNITDTHGWVLTLCGGTDGEHGMDLLKNLVDNKPDFVEAHYHLGMAFLNKQRPADALAELTAASEKFKAQEQTIMLTAPQLKAQIADGLKRAQEQGGAKTDAGGR